MSDKPNYRLLDKFMRGGRIIPFLGAGASFGSRVPGEAPWRNSKKGVVALPSASELAAYLAREADFPEKNATDLPKVSQFYDTTIGRPDLVQELNAIFACNQEPTAIHRYIAECAKSANQLIVTTNYDDLVERAFDIEGIPYDVIVHVARSTESGMVVWRAHGQQPRELLAKDVDVDPAKTHVIYKIHGAIDRGNPPDYAHYVITEDDYIDFLSRTPTVIPKVLVEEFQKRHFLFLGYGLHDWNVRVVLNRVTKMRGVLGQQQSWAIETQKRTVEKKLWTARGVTVYDQTSIDGFVGRLCRARVKR